MSVSLDELSSGYADIWIRLRDELFAIIGEDLTALWAYGARTFPDPPRSLGDLDTYGVLERTPSEDDGRQIWRVLVAIQEEHAVKLDIGSILTVDAARRDFPPDAWGKGRQLNWAFQRAHWLAGRYALLHGRKPEELVSAPSWNELEAALGHEVEHLENHVAWGDDDPYEASYAMLNGSRIIYSIETRDVVISKRGAGEWAIQNLPSQFRAAIQAAGRAYDGESSPEDARVLSESMAPFVAMVRKRWDERTRSDRKTD